MKGGEIVNFRHFLISGLMLGTAMFLPGHAFAEGNELSGQQNSQNASLQANPSVKTNHAAVQTNIPAKTENNKSLVIPKSATKDQGGVKQQPSQMTPQQAASVVQQNLPNQAKGNVQSTIKKTKKIVHAVRQDKVVAVPENNKGLVKNQPTPKKGAGNSTIHSLHKTDTDVKNKVQSTRLVHKVEPQQKWEGSHFLVLKKEGRSERLVQEPPKRGKVPTSKEEIPVVSQDLNPTQRTNSSGGQSNDRVSNGFSTISVMDKWFEWKKYFEVKLVQPYLSRHELLSNQWVNAPPSPPPQEAPLLKTVYRC